MTDEMREHIKLKEKAYLARKAGLPVPLPSPAKVYWWEKTREEGGD